MVRDLYGACDQNIPELKLINPKGEICTPETYDYLNLDLAKWWMTDRNRIIYAIPEGCVVIGCTNGFIPYEKKYEITDAESFLEKYKKIRLIQNNIVFMNSNHPKEKALEKTGKIYGEIQIKYRATKAILQKSPSALNYVEKNIRKPSESVLHIQSLLQIMKTE